MEKTGNGVLDGGPVGLIGQWVALGTGLVSRTIGTGFGILQDVRTEIAARVGATIDWVDSSQQGTIRLLRSIHQRIDTLSKETFDAGEHALTGVVSGVRSTSDEATRFASHATRVLMDAPAAN